MPYDAPKTVAMRRRLFRKPKAHDEPRYDVDVFPQSLPLEADLLYLGQIADERAARRRGSASRKTPAASRKAHGPNVATRDRRLRLGEDEENAEIAGAIMESDADSAHADPRAASPDTSSGSHDGSSQGSSADDVYEVEALLEEDESGEGKGFLIRWAGFTPDHDSWEPESHIAPELVAAYRRERNLARSNRGDDYMLGRTRMLWCSPCAAHHPADNFSSNQRRVHACGRACLSHHYKVQAAPHVSLLTGASHETPSRTKVAATLRKQKKRSRDDDDDSDALESDEDNDDNEEVEPPSRRAAPWAPSKAQRFSPARALSHRQAALEVSNSRLFGFSSW